MIAERAVEIDVYVAADAVSTGLNGAKKLH